MPPPKPFKPVETPDLVYKEGIKGPARPLAAPISHSVTVPMPAVMSVPEPAPVPRPAKYDRKQLQLDSKELTGRMTRWLLEGDRLETMLAETKFRDITVALGIMTDKMLLLEGQPTTIIGQAEQKKMDEILPALMQEMKRRGVKAELTERKAVMTIAPEQ